MLSTPITKIRARSGAEDGERGTHVRIQEVDSFSDDGESDDSLVGDDGDARGGRVHAGGGATTETHEPFAYSRIEDVDDDDGEDDLAPDPVHVPERSRTTQRQVRKSTSARRMRSQDSGPINLPLWRAVVSKPFCQAIVLTFAIVCAVTLSPLATLITDRVPSIAHLPHVKSIISSLISAVLVTAMRPPIA